MEKHCNHFDEIHHTTSDKQGCEDCLKLGKRDWVHLRLCLVCGYVGCCDDSPGTHATKHFQETGHATIRGFQPGETWGYCYEDDLYIEEMLPPINI